MSGPLQAEALAIYGVVNAGRARLAVPIAILQEVIVPPTRFTTDFGAPDHVLGTFNLRGSAIPTIDLRRLLGEDTDGTPPGHIVILRTDQGRMGMGVDGIGSMIRSPASHLHRVADAQGEAHRLGTHLLMAPDSQDILAVLDPETLAARPGVRLLRESDTLGEAAVDDQMQRFFLHFDLGPHRLCIDIAAVQQIIPHPPIEVTALVTESFKGMVHLRGRSIAAFDLRNLLALPPHDMPDAPAHMLILGNTAMRCAISVNAVVRLSQHTDAALEPIPPQSLRLPKMFQGLLAQEQGDALLIDHTALLADSTITAACRLCQGIDDSAAARDVAGGAWSKLDVLSFESAGQSYNTRLSAIRDITPMPQTLLRLGDPLSLSPYTARLNNRLVPLIHLRTLAGQAQCAPAPQSLILLVEDEAGVVGFIVDRLDAIRHVMLSDDTKGIEAGNGGSATTPEAFLAGRTQQHVVQTKDKQMTLKLLDLVGLSQDVTNWLTHAA